jgi:nitronate monooxygenase
MLEAERAGAKALVVFMNDWPRNGADWKVLRKIHDDEAHNCALLGELLKKAGAAYSHATGEFYDKAVAVEGRRERLAFLVKGLEWAVRKFDQAAPQDPEARKLFQAIAARHRRSIAAISDGLLRA